MEARIARLSDYTGLARLCRRAVGPGDYVIHYLNDAIRKRGVFMALEEGQLVGMSEFRRCVDGSGWLGMARTDPNYRRRGVALFLQRSIASHSRRKGIRTLRMWVLKRNSPALKAAEKGGFRQVSEAVHVSRIFRSKPKREGLASVKSVNVKLADDALASSYLSKMNGYMGYGWHFVKPDRRVLRKTARNHKLFLVDGTVFILSEQDYAGGAESEHRHREFSLLLGPAQESFGKVKEAARLIGLGGVGSYLPRDSRLLGLAEREGFHVDSWGDHCVVFEKQLH